MNPGYTDEEFFRNTEDPSGTSSDPSQEPLTVDLPDIIDNPETYSGEPLLTSPAPSASVDEQMLREAETDLLSPAVEPAAKTEQPAPQEQVAQEPTMAEKLMAEQQPMDFSSDESFFSGLQQTAVSSSDQALDEYYSGTVMTPGEVEDSEATDKAKSEEPEPWFKNLSEKGFPAGTGPFDVPFGMGETLPSEMSEKMNEAEKFLFKAGQSELAGSATRGWKLGQQAFAFNVMENLGKGLPDAVGGGYVRSGAITAAVELGQEIQQIPVGEDTARVQKLFNEAESVGDFWEKSKELAREKGTAGMLGLAANVLGNIGTESTTSFLPTGILSAIAIKNPFAASFLTSLSIEGASQYLENLKENGVDISDPDAVEKAVNDPVLSAQARKSALAKGIPVALFDAITFGVGGKMAKGIYKKVLKTMGRNALGRVTGYTVAGAPTIATAGVAGSTGEYAGQVSQRYADTGEFSLKPSDPFGVAAEFLGESTGPFIGGLATETAPNLFKRSGGREGLSAFSEYLRESGAPQTANAVEQANQAMPADQAIAQVTEAADRLVAERTARAGRTEPIAEVPEQKEEAPKQEQPKPSGNLDIPLNSFDALGKLKELQQRLSTKENKDEEGQAKQAASGKEPTTETDQAQAEAKPAAKEGEPKPDQQGDEASQTSLEEPAAAPAPAPVALTNSLSPIAYKNNLVWDNTAQKANTESGESTLVDLGDRVIALVNVNGQNIPFYLSTGKAGKKKTKAGKWYPTLGIDDSGWINKGTDTELSAYYNSPELKRIAEQLDATIGTNTSSAKKVGAKAIYESVNQGLKNIGITPVENGTPTTIQSIQENAKKLTEFVKPAPTPTPAPAVTPAPVEPTTTPTEPATAAVVTSLEEDKAGAAELEDGFKEKYGQSVDYMVDWYINKKRRDLLFKDMMTADQIFPKDFTASNLIENAYRELMMANLAYPETEVEAVQFVQSVVTGVRQRMSVESPKASGGEAPPPPEDQERVSEKNDPMSSKLSALEHLEIESKRLSDTQKPVKRGKSYSGTKVSGEYVFPQERAGYLDGTEEAPGEDVALKKADEYFKKKAAQIRRDFPQLNFDETRLSNAARLRFQRHYRNKHQDLQLQGSMTKAEASERFLMDIAQKLSPSKIFGSVFKDYGRALARRTNAKIGMETTSSLDAVLGPDRDMFLSDMTSPDETDAENDQRVLADLSRNSRNTYFQGIANDLPKQLLLRAMLNSKNLVSLADIAKDSGRLAKIRDALSLAGINMTVPQLETEAKSLADDFITRVGDNVNRDFSRYKATGELPAMVEGPETTTTLPASTQSKIDLAPADREAHSIAEEMLDDLRENKYLNEQQVVAVQDILDMSPRKSSAMKAMQKMRELLAGDLPQAPVKQVKVKQISANPETPDQTPDTMNLMPVQRTGASMIFNAYLRGRKGSLLADEPGLGKTLTALAAARMIADYQAKRIQSVTGEETKSGKIVYITESRELIDAENSGAKAQLLRANIPSNRVYFKTYDDYSKGKIDFSDADVIVFDEAHNLKNPESERSRLAQVSEAFHIYVSATPADKTRGIRYFLPRVTGRSSTEIEDALSNSKDKASTIASYLDLASENYGYIRREAVKKLPPAQVIRVALPQETKDQLEQIEKYHKVRLDKLSEQELSGELSEAQINTERLRIVADMKRSLERWLELAKAEPIYEMAKEALANGRQVLIFGESVSSTVFQELGSGESLPSLLEYLNDRFTRDGVGVAAIYGEGGDQMTSDINDFQRGKKKVALATPYKGGAGLSLDDQTGNNPRTVINATINEAADKDEQMRYRAGGRLSSRSETEYYEIFAPEATTDRQRQEMRVAKQKILKATQGLAPDARDPNQMLIQFSGVINTSEAPTLTLSEADPTATPEYQVKATTNEMVNRQRVDNKYATLKRTQREAVRRLASALDSLGFRNVKIVFGKYSTKAAWTDYRNGDFNAIYVNPEELADSLSIVGLSGYGDEYLTALATEEMHHNAVYETVAQVAAKVFSEKIATQQTSVQQAFRETFNAVLRGVYDEMTPAMRAEIQNRYRSPLTVELTALEYTRSLYQEVKLGFTTEDLTGKDRRQTLEKKLKGVPKDGVIRMWLELLRKSVIDLLAKTRTTFSQSPKLANLLDATDNVIQYLTDNGKPLQDTDRWRNSVYPRLAEALGLYEKPKIEQDKTSLIEVKSTTDLDKLAEDISLENAKAAAPVDGVVMSQVKTFTIGLSGKQYPATYAWVRADKLQSSHKKDFSVNPKYQGFLNTRDYAADKQEQEKVLAAANDFKPYMFVTTSNSANGGLQTVVRGLRSGEFLVMAGNGRELIAKHATEKTNVGKANLEVLIEQMRQLAAKEGVPIPQDVENYRLVKLSDVVADESSEESRGEINNLISDLNDGGGLQVSALGKAEQDLPTITGNATLMSKLEKIATGEVNLGPSVASDFIREAVAMGAINRQERGFLSLPSERLMAQSYVRYMLARIYANPDIQLARKGVNPQVGFAQEVMSLGDATWSMVSGLLRVNAMATQMGKNGETLKKAVSQLIYNLTMQPGDEKSDFVQVFKTFMERPDDMLTLMGTEDQQKAIRMAERLGDMFVGQMVWTLNKRTGMKAVAVAKTRARFGGLIRAMGDMLYQSYRDIVSNKNQTSLGGILDESVDPIDYMIEVMKAKIETNPTLFDPKKNEDEEDVDASGRAAASTPEEEAFPQPATQDDNEDSEDAQDALTDTTQDEELSSTSLAWKAWREDGEVDYGFKSRTAYNKLVTALDQAGYGKYLRLKKVIEAMASDPDWVDEMTKRMDEESELRDLMDKAIGMSPTRKQERLRMALPSKDETFELMRQTTVTAKDGRVAMLLEPILGAIQYPKVSDAVSKQREAAMDMFVKAQLEVERLVKAKELKILRENPRFAKETQKLLEEINEGYQKWITQNVSLNPEILDEAENSKDRVMERRLKQKPTAAEKFIKEFAELTRMLIEERSIARAKTAKSVRQNIADTVKILNKVEESIKGVDRMIAMTAMRLAGSMQDGKRVVPDVVTKQRLVKESQKQEVEINRLLALKKRYQYVLLEYEAYQNLDNTKVKETIFTDRRMTKSELDNLPNRVKQEFMKRMNTMTTNYFGERSGKAGFVMEMPFYRGVVEWIMAGGESDGRRIIANTINQPSQARSMIVSYQTKNGEVPLPTDYDGNRVTREMGKRAASAYYRENPNNLITRNQVPGEAANIVLLEPLGVSFRGDKFYDWKPKWAKTNHKILELPKALRYSKEEPEVNERGERWFEFILDPENKRSHQMTYVRATNPLDAIRKAIQKLAENGGTLLYKNKAYSKREPKRTIEVPISKESEADSGLPSDELEVRKAIRDGEVEKLEELAKKGKAKRDDFLWFIKQEVESIITGLLSSGKDIMDPEVIKLASRYGFVDLKPNRKPDLMRLRKMQEIALGRSTPKTMQQGKGMGRTGVIKDVSENLKVFSKAKLTKRVPAPQQSFRIPELPRKTSEDVLKEIASTNGISVQELREANNLTGAALAPGSMLVIPGTTRSVTVPNYENEQSGMSLLDVAKKFGVTREELAKENNLPENYQVKPGDEIIIPATGYVDTTEELVLRLFKERVYEKGPTMLRVNTPPPGVVLKTKSGTPAAASTVELDDNDGLFRGKEFTERSVRPVVNYQNALALTVADKIKTSPIDSVLKEAVQNAWDAIKASGRKDGTIDVTVDAKEKLIRVVDNGAGMSPETVEESFFGLFNPSKDLEEGEASGGFGRGIKEAMVCGEIRLLTAKDGVVTTASSTPEEMFAEDLAKRPKMRTAKASEMVPDGTTLEVRFRDKLVIPGRKTRELSMYFPHASDFMDKPLIGDVTVNYRRRQPKLWSSDFEDSFSVVTLDIGKKLGRAGWRPVKKGEYAWGKVEMYTRPKQHEFMRNYASIDVMSSGVFQLTLGDYAIAKLVGIPKERLNELLGPTEFMLDLKSKARPGDLDYPFTPNREGLNVLAAKDIKEYLTELVGDAATEETKTYLEDLTSSATVIGADGKLQSPKAGKLFLPTEPQFFSFILEGAYRGSYNLDLKSESVDPKFKAYVQDYAIAVHETVMEFAKAKENIGVFHSKGDKPETALGQNLPGAWAVGAMIDAKADGLAIRTPSQIELPGQKPMQVRLVLANALAGFTNRNATNLFDANKYSFRSPIEFAQYHLGVIIHEISHIRTHGEKSGEKAEAEVAREFPEVYARIPDMAAALERLAVVFAKHGDTINKYVEDFNQQRRTSDGVKAKRSKLRDKAVSEQLETQLELVFADGRNVSEAEVSKPKIAGNEGSDRKSRERPSRDIEARTYSLSIGPHETVFTEATSKRKGISNNVAKLFARYKTLLFNGKAYTKNQFGLLVNAIDNARGWNNPVRIVDYGADGSASFRAAAPEVEFSPEDMEKIYKARSRILKREGKLRTRRFAKRYGEDGEISKDLRDIQRLNQLKYAVRTQPLRAEEATRLIQQAGGAIAAAREIVAPEIENPELAAFANNPIEFDNLVILNNILLKQLDQSYKIAKSLKDELTASEAMGLSMALAGKQSELGTRLGRGLAAFAAYARLSPAGWRYFASQMIEKARLEQIQLLPEQINQVIGAGDQAVRVAFEKVINKPEIKKLLDKLDELADLKTWDNLLKKAKRVSTLAKASKNLDEAGQKKNLEAQIENAKELIAMIKAQKDDLADIQLESVIGEGLAAALMAGFKSAEKAAEALGVKKEEVLDAIEPAQDVMDEVRKKSVDDIRRLLPEDMRDKPLNFLFDGDMPAAASEADENIEDGVDPEDELEDAKELQADKMLTKLLKEFAKDLRDKDKEKAIPQDKVISVVRRVLREGLQSVDPSLKITRAKLSAMDRKQLAVDRFRKALSVWNELYNSANDQAVIAKVAEALTKILNAGQTSVILNALEAAMDKPYTKTDLRAFTTLSRSDIRGFMFSRRFLFAEKKLEVLRELLDELEAAGLSVEDKLLNAVLSKITQDLDQMAVEEFQKMLKGREFTALPKKWVFEEKANEIVGLILAGKYGHADMFEKLASKLNLEDSKWRLPNEVYEKITEQAEEIANDPDGPNSRRAMAKTVDLLDMIRKNVGIPIKDVFKSFFYIHIIGALKTVSLNMLAPVGNALHFLLLPVNDVFAGVQDKLIEKIPSSRKAIGSLRLKGGQYQALRYAMRGLKTALNAGLTEFLEVMATGNIAGKLTYMDTAFGVSSKRKTGRTDIELFLDKDTKLEGPGWLQKMVRFWYGMGGKGLSIPVGISKDVWDKAFSIYKTKPVKAMAGNVKTPQYPEGGVKAQISITGLDVLLGRLYSGMDVFWSTVYGEIHAAMNAYELARVNLDDSAQVEDITRKADILMGYGLSQNLSAARLIAKGRRQILTASERRDFEEKQKLRQREKAIAKEAETNPDVDGHHPIIEELARQTDEEQLARLRLKPNTSRFRQQLYAQRLMDRANLRGIKLPEILSVETKGDMRKMAVEDLEEYKRAATRRNDMVNKMIWESVYMGQWMAQVNKPYGLIGHAAKFLERIAMAPGFGLVAYVQPFYSIVANVWSVWLNWLGFGVLKNINAKWRSQVQVYGEGARLKPDSMAAYEITSGMAGASVMLLVIGLTLASMLLRWKEDEDEDQDSWFDISGSGPKDVNQRRNLEASGNWQRDSIKFGKLWVKNPNWAPTYLLIKSIGEMKDYLKYERPSHARVNEIGLGLMGGILTSAVKGPLDVPFVSGAKTLIEATDTRNPNWMSKFGQIIFRTIGAILVPGVAREADQRLFDPVVREKSGGIVATALGNMPFLRQFGKPLTNVLGEEVTFANLKQDDPMSVLRNYAEMFASDRSGHVDPLFEVLAAKNAWVTLPEKNIFVMGVKLNDEQRDVWVMARARLLREELRSPNAVSELWGMYPGEAQQYVGRLTAIANKYADSEVLNKFELDSAIQEQAELEAMYGRRGTKQ